VDNDALKKRVEVLNKDITDRQAHYEKAIKVIEEVEKKDSELIVLKEALERMTDEIKAKDEQVEALKEALVRDAPDEPTRNTRLQKKNEVIQQLTANLEVGCWRMGRGERKGEGGMSWRR
jgi:lipopolysaccharide biosynthesis regulator YciM